MLICLLLTLNSLNIYIRHADSTNSSKMNHLETTVSTQYSNDEVNRDESPVYEDGIEDDKQLFLLYSQREIDDNMMESPSSASQKQSEDDTNAAIESFSDDGEDVTDEVYILHMMEAYISYYSDSFDETDYFDEKDEYSRRRWILGIARTALDMQEFIRQEQVMTAESFNGTRFIRVKFINLMQWFQHIYDDFDFDINSGVSLAVAGCAISCLFRHLPAFNILYGRTNICAPVIEDLFPIQDFEDISSPTATLGNFIAVRGKVIFSEAAADLDLPIEVIKLVDMKTSNCTPLDVILYKAAEDIITPFSSRLQSRESLIGNIVEISGILSSRSMVNEDGDTVTIRYLLGHAIRYYRSPLNDPYQLCIEVSTVWGNAVRFHCGYRTDTVTTAVADGNSLAVLQQLSAPQTQPSAVTIACGADEAEADNDFKYLTVAEPLEDYHSLNTPSVVEKLLVLLPPQVMLLDETLVDSKYIELGICLEIQGVLVRFTADDYKPLHCQSEFYFRAQSIKCLHMGAPPKFTAIGDMLSPRVGDFVKVRATVIRVKPNRPTVEAMNFVCNKCDNIVRLTLVDGKYMTPQACTKECNSRQFTPLRQTAKLYDCQSIRIQECQDEYNRKTSKSPKTIDVELTGSMIDSVVSGDTVIVTGIVKTVQIDTGKGNQKVNSSLFVLYLLAKTISKDGEDKDLLVSGEDYADKDLRLFAELSQNHQLFELLIKSFCPGIKGQDIIKAGIVLSLFGGAGSGDIRDSTASFSTRADSHLLMIGEPGMGKSQMLQAIDRVSPRCVFVTGGTSTTAGLTVTMVRDSSSGQQSLEAGALVLADRGVCCIDELDKMGADMNTLLEAMEQQTVSIAKAGVSITLRAQATVIAAANPVGGHYAHTKTLSENINMNPALISRFDLVFVMMDKPDLERDRWMASHVVGIHTLQEGRSESRSSFQPQITGRESQLALRLLEYTQNFDGDVIPEILIRKYLAYARKRFYPLLSDEAISCLKEEYMRKRAESFAQPDVNVQYTTRNLEGLIRLSQARAKVESREIVTVADVRDVLDIVDAASLKSQVPFQVPIANFFVRDGGINKSKFLKTFMDKLSFVGLGKDMTKIEVMMIATSLHSNIERVWPDLFDVIIDKGVLLQKGGGKYRVLRM